MDNTMVFSNASIWVFQQMFESLYEVTPDGKDVKPLLAESYTLSDDKLTWTFTLKQGVKFSNGAPMTSADVKFSLDKARATKGGWEFLDVAIKSVDAPDPGTVVIKTKYPWAPLLADLANFSNAVLPKDYAGKSQDDFYKAPVGTGPFVWDHWTRAASSSSRRTRPTGTPASRQLDSVTWKVVPDDNSRNVQIQGGQAQINENPPFSSVEQLKGQPGVKVDALPEHQDRLHHDEPEREAVRRRARAPRDLVRDRPRGAGQDAAVRQRHPGELVPDAERPLLRRRDAGHHLRHGQGQGGAGAVVGAQRLHHDVPGLVGRLARTRRSRRCCSPRSRSSGSR